jgi:hypothetical protein
VNAHRYDVERKRFALLLECPEIDLVIR